MKTKTKALGRGVLFLGTISFITVLAFLVALSASAASTDYFLKLDGVEGESTKSSTQTQTAEIQTSPYRPLPVEETKPAPGVEPDEIDYDASQETNFGVLLDGGAGEMQTEEEEKKVNDGYNWKVEEGTKILVNVAEVRGWDQEKKEEFLSTTNLYSYAESEQDLKNFALDVMLNDENIEEVQFTSEEIQLIYKVSGKLLWIFPVTFSERIIAEDKGDQDPKVKVKLPWYGFLLNPDVDPSDVVDEIKELHSKTTEVESWSFGASTSGRSLQIMTSVLRTKHDTVKNAIGNIR